MPSGKVKLKRTINGLAMYKQPVAGEIAHGIPVKELIFLPLTEFPVKGDSRCLYIDTTNKNIYYWEDQSYWSLTTNDMFFSGTTEYWNVHGSSVSKKDAFYVYTDFDTKDGVPIPSIKIGDGLAYINSLPFISACGITQDDIDFWNNKVSAKISESNPEEIVFYTGRE